MSSEATSGEALMGVLEQLSQETNPDIRTRTDGVVVNWQKRTLRFSCANYEIDLNVIRTERDALEWVKHLCDKTRIDRDLMREFVQAVDMYLRLNRRGS